MRALETPVDLVLAAVTSHLIYPPAVGGDIGRGMLAVAFDVEAARLDDPSIAGRVLAQLGRTVPTRRRNRRATASLPTEIEQITLSHASIEATRCTEGALKSATLGSGLRALDPRSEAGVAYLHDASWARRFADASRRAMAADIGRLLEAMLGGRICWGTAIATDHNHVSLEQHGGCESRTRHSYLNRMAPCICLLFALSLTSSRETMTLISGY
jgi:tRNA-splicing ligase RtcB (3'-phosphate/5'-hydroxy nucleic acid ligase)